MPDNRKICVVTGTRAEYGTLSNLMREISIDPALELQLVVTGSHLSPEFGNTYKFIEQDGFVINEKVDILQNGDSMGDIARATGAGVSGISQAYERLGPDIVVVLGDRYEILAAAQAAMLMKIPLAHIHGGETTEGAVDESIRHAITKMAHLHFTSTEPYRKRVIQMGENPDNVYAVGAPGLDNFALMELPDRGELEASLGRELTRPLFLVTYHPVTLGDKTPQESMGELLSALEAFPEALCVITKANADAGGRAINTILEDFADRHSDKVILVDSLGQARYLGMLKIADAVIGNSSSGIIEAPGAGTPTVNIGIRQKGRIRATSVIDCDEKSSDIEAAVRLAMSESFKEKISSQENPYGTPGEVSSNIKKIIGSVDLDGLLIKHFFDWDYSSKSDKP